MFTGLVDDVGTIERVEHDRRGARAPRRVSLRRSRRRREHRASTAPASPCASSAPAGSPSPRSSRRSSARRSATGAGGASISSARCASATGSAGISCRGTSTASRRSTAFERHGDATPRRPCSPAGLAELMVPHGSVTVDGVSLTVNDLPAPDDASTVAHRIHACGTRRSARSRGTSRARRSRHDREVRASASCSRAP